MFGHEIERLVNELMVRVEDLEKRVDSLFGLKDTNEQTKLELASNLESVNPVTAPVTQNDAPTS